MGYILIRAVNWFAQLLIWLLIARAFLSWIANDPYSQLGKIYMTVLRLTEPIVEPCRRLIARFNINTGMFDFSVLIALFGIEIIARIVTVLLYTIFY